MEEVSRFKLSQEASHRAEPGPALRDKAVMQGSARLRTLPSTVRVGSLASRSHPDTGFHVHQEHATASKSEGSTMTPKRQVELPQHRLQTRKMRVLGPVYGDLSPQRCPCICSYEGGKRGRHFRFHLLALFMFISVKCPSVVCNGRKH